MVMAFPPLQM